MSSWSAEFKRLQAAQRREERESKKRQRELERRLKEKAKLSEQERARLEVEQFENAVEVLLSVHKEQSTKVDWVQLASALPPHEPRQTAKHELAAFLTQATNWEAPEGQKAAAIEVGMAEDQRDYEAALEVYRNECDEWQSIRLLAERIIGGDISAYEEAVHEFSALSEISSFGPSVYLKFHSPTLIESKLYVKGQDVIPKEVKSLTATGKLTVKAMPKARFHEIYQDYACGCVLRLAREVFALLPADTVFVSATIEGESRNERSSELPVLSAVFSRDRFLQLDFARLDPSDTVEDFPHRGDAKASKKSGEFTPIIPFTVADLVLNKTKPKDLAELLSSVRELRNELAATARPAVQDELLPEAPEPIP